MKFTLPYPPTLNNLKAVVRGRLITTAQARQYMALVRALASQQGVKPITTGPVVVRVWAHRPRKAGDLDNTLKAAFDALKGIAWGDDSQVVEIYATRHDDKANPRLEIDVEQFHEEEAAEALAAIGVKHG